MAKFEIDVSDDILLRIGKQNIVEKFNDCIEVSLMTNVFKDISQAIRDIDLDYDKEIEKIRIDSWNEYKNGFLK